MIIWVEDPKKYRYLRKTRDYFSTRRFPIKTLGNSICDFYKLIGYELIDYHSSSNYPFLFDYYWLKTYDDGCPSVKCCYYDDGGKPCEGIDVTELLKHNSVNRYCFECIQFHSNKNNCELHKMRQYPNNPVACPNFKEFKFWGR
jgi:hypothetical protein